MKKLFFIAALAATSFAVKAQDAAQPIKFSLGADVGLPVGDFITSDAKFSDGYSLGLGASLQGTYALDPSLGATLNIGFMSYLPKTVDGEKAESLTAIPILAGIEYNFTPQVFASAQLGYSIYSGKFLKDNDLTLGGFTYAPGIGYRFSDNFSALLKYQGASVKLKGSGEKISGNLSQIGLRIAYTF
jgi:opacity protein-like surface antigen